MLPKNIYQRYILPLSLEAISTSCIKNFKAEMVDVFKKKDNTYQKEISSSDTYTLDQMKSISSKKYCVASSNSIPDTYIRYLISIEMKEDSTICIEKTLPYLIISIFLTLIFSIIINFYFDTQYKKSTFFAINLFVLLPINFFLIKSFYNKIHSNKNKYDDILTYILNSSNKNTKELRTLLKYQNNSIQFGKLYQYYIGAYFVIIITFTFYCASLMYTT